MVRKPPYAIKGMYGGVRGGESPLLARPDEISSADELPEKTYSFFDEMEYVFFTTRESLFL